MRTVYFISVAMLGLALSACQTSISSHTKASKPVVKKTVRVAKPKPYMSFEDKLIATEKQASPAGRAILTMGRIMTLSNREIVRGGCWDYANVVYNRAGYPDKKRQTMFKTKKHNNQGYAPTQLIQPGDWLYYINHSYGGVEHSAIFVGWVNQQNAEGLMLSYGGEGRNAPARYLSYDLSSVYRIVRGK